MVDSLLVPQLFRLYKPIRKIDELPDRLAILVSIDTFPAHMALFYTNRCHTPGKLYGEGKGRTKKDAEKQAAEDAIAKLKKRGLL